MYNPQNPTPNQLDKPTRNQKQKLLRGGSSHQHSERATNHHRNPYNTSNKNKPT